MADPFETVKHCLFCDNHPSEDDHYDIHNVPISTQEGTTVFHLLLTCRHAREEHDIHTNELLEIARISFLVIASVHYSDEAMKLRVGEDNYGFLMGLGNGEKREA